MSINGVNGPAKADTSNKAINSNIDNLVLSLNNPDSDKNYIKTQLLILAAQSPANATKVADAVAWQIRIGAFSAGSPSLSTAKEILNTLYAQPDTYVLSDKTRGGVLEVINIINGLTKPDSSGQSQPAAPTSIPAKVLYAIGRWLAGIGAGKEPNLDPALLLEEINQNETMQKIAGLKIENLQSDEWGAWDPRTPKGDKAVALFQRALLSLGLYDIDQKKPHWWAGFSFGAYDSETEEAVAELERIAGISPKVLYSGLDSEPENYRGASFDKYTLRDLKTALEAKAQGKDWREVFGK